MNRASEFGVIMFANFLMISTLLISETPVNVRRGDTVFAVYSYVAETNDAINLVEGERLYILGKQILHHFISSYMYFNVVLVTKLYVALWLAL